MQDAREGVNHICTREGWSGCGRRGRGPGWDACGTGRGAVDLVDVGDKPAFSGRVDLLVVGSQLALDGEQQYFQVPFLCEPETGGQVGVRVKGH